jgi:hypothetical protein
LCVDGTGDVDAGDGSTPVDDDVDDDREGMALGMEEMKDEELT